MSERLSGPCCVLRRAMSYDRAGVGVEARESVRFQVLLAAACAMALAALFIA